MKKLLVLGHAGVGKDTVCELLCETKQLVYKHTSMIAAKIVMQEFEKLDIKYDSAKDCYEDRNKHRNFWFSTLREYNYKYANAFFTLATQESDIYCGMRDTAEFRAVLPEVRDVIYVKRDGILVDKTMRIACMREFTVLTNNGSLAELKEKVADLVLANINEPDYESWLSAKMFFNRSIQCASY